MILIATPTRDTVTAGFTADLVKLCRRHPEARWMAPLGIYIAPLRNQAASAALQMGASHVLFLDADMRFPEDTLARLLAGQRDLIAANYVQRTMPEWWVARREGQVVSSQQRTGLECVDSVGCGVLLIRTSVFQRLARPWFDTPAEGTSFIGEDVYFCRKAAAAGSSVWIDHDVSQQVRHQGMIEYGVQTRDVEAVA